MPPPSLPPHFKILLTGATSIHGWPIFSRLRKITSPGQLLAIRPPKMNVPEGTDVLSLCITDRQKLSSIRDTFSPTHIIHAAGVCDLDVCEERPQWAEKMNVIGAQVIADVFGPTSYIMYLSADLVFSGNNPPEGGYRETDIPDPVSVAGRTFAAAEKLIAACPRSCIVRLGLPLGASVNGEKGAIDFVDRRLKRGLPMTLFHDEIRSCISVSSIADAVVELLLREASGFFHCGGDEPRSLFEVGQSVLSKGNHKKHLLKTISRFEEKDGPPRMGNVSLNSSRLKSLLEINILQ